eukprot:Rmarinus@m.17596
MKWIIFLILFTAHGVLWNISTSMVPEYYMDEVFHGPQTELYCSGEWRKWNDKITTPPGVYIASVALSKVIGLFLSKSWCGLPLFRATSALYHGITSLVVHEILGTLHPTSHENQRFWRVLLICCFPPYFFLGGLLYYTDSLSVLLVMLSLLSSFHRRPWISALFALASVGVRQTNIVWGIFSGILPLILSLDSTLNPVRVFRQLWQNRLSVLSTTLPFVLLAAMFAAFVVWNGGIVLGDRSAHQSSAHLSQAIYFTLTLVGFGLPVRFLRWFSRSCGVSHSPGPRGSLRTLVPFWGVFVLAAHYGTIAHPYLLADNRHYTFYIWKNVLGRSPWVRYAVAAFAATGLDVARVSLLQGLGPLGCLAMLIGTCAVLIPAPLLEFRYFIMPYFFAMLFVPLRDTHPPCPSADGSVVQPLSRCLAEAASGLSVSGLSAKENRTLRERLPKRASKCAPPAAVSVAAGVVASQVDPDWNDVVACLVCAAVNIATIVVFLTRPFTWPDGSVARFLW